MNTVISLLLSLAFLILAIYNMTTHLKRLKQLRSEGIETTGTIISITGPRRNHTAHISYTVDGKEYTAELNFYSNRMRIGDSIRLYVDRNNHQRFVADSKMPIVLGIMFILLSAALTIAQLLILLRIIPPGK